jgi:DNA-binding FadR family transcriptional regulator
MQPVAVSDMADADNAAEPRRAADGIAEALVADIRAGRLTVDEPLPTERALAERFGASRPTVRAALGQLAARGYLTGEPGHRPRAARPSLVAVLAAARDHVREILGDAESGAHLEQMRQFIESGAARAAATRADPLHMARLNATLEANFAAIGTPDFPRTDVAFHRALVSAVGNPVILTLHDMFVSALLAQRPAQPDQPAHDRVAYGEHRAIYQAILAADAETAAAVMDAHLARSWRARLRPPPAVTEPDPSQGAAVPPPFSQGGQP